MPMTRRAVLAWAGTASAVLRLGTEVVRADDYPTRAVRLVVAFPPGGPTDFVARIVAEKLGALLGQSVIVENRPGANGAVGGDYVAHAAPDGYVLFFTTVGAVAVTPHLVAKPPYDPLRDFAPISLVVRNTTILVVRPDMPVSSAKELAALARQKPGTVPIASTGVGSMPHLALELFQSAAGVKFLHVPYRGAASALTDLLGGQVQGLFADAPVLLPHIQSGKVKAIGAAANARNPVLPDVPTLAEQGFPDTDADNWYGLLAPARVPAEIQMKLHDALVTALADPEVSRKLRQSGAIPAPTTQQAFAGYLHQELDRWGKVVHDKGIKAED